MGSEGEFPLDTITEAHSLGLTNLHIPEEYGGAGMGILEEAIVSEEMSWETQDSEPPSIPMV